MFEQQLLGLSSFSASATAAVGTDSIAPAASACRQGEEAACKQGKEAACKVKRQPCLLSLSLSSRRPSLDSRPQDRQSAL